MVITVVYLTTLSLSRRLASPVHGDGKAANWKAIMAAGLPVLCGTFRDTKVVLQKDLKNTKRNSVCTEPPPANHLTVNKSTQREFKLLPSSALVSSYITTPLGFYWQDRLAVLCFCFTRKAHAKRQYQSIPSGSNLQPHEKDHAPFWAGARSNCAMQRKRYAISELRARRI